MGDFLSKPSQPDSTATSTTSATPTPTMSPPNSEQPHDTKTPESNTPNEKNHDSPTDPNSAEIHANPSEKETPTNENLKESIKDGDVNDERTNEEEDEEEGECGFCLFMKGGGCKDTFTEWEICVEESERNKENIVDKCFQATEALKKCMEVHSDYYAPLLQAEKAAEEDAVKQLEEERKRSVQESVEKEKEENSAIPTTSSPNSEQPHHIETLESNTPNENNPDSPTDPNSAEIQGNPSGMETPTGENLKVSIENGDVDERGTEEEEEEGECGFCLFMKGGECKDSFTEWEKCIEEGERNEDDILEKCFQATTDLKKCMEVHSDYYAPLLQAEKAAEEEAAKQLEEERERSVEESAAKETEEISSASDEKNSL